MNEIDEDQEAGNFENGVKYIEKKLQWKLVVMLVLKRREKSIFEKIF